MQVRGWEQAEVRETHISVVLIGPDRVLKIKKPVDMGFLDFTTLEARQRACEAELALNERTAAGITLGVRRLTATQSGGVEVDGQGATEGWAVEMLRLPDERRMVSLLEHGELGIDEVDRVALWLAGFHADCPPRPNDGTAEVVSRLVEENFAQLPQADQILGPVRAEEARAWQRRALRAERIESRSQSGWVRDGHGDLRLDHVYMLTPPWAPRVVAIDGVEFDERYRCLDVAADLAFLVMELELHGRHDLAERLAWRWAQPLGDWDVYEVLDGYVAYRAWVRAKVRMMQGHSDAARGRLELAWSVGARAASAAPVMVAVGGPIAAGKSTVAEQLSRALHAPVIDADRTRKQLAGVQLDERLGDVPFAGAYSDARTEQVYEALLQRAQPVLRSGRSVILDASFRAPGLRAQVRRAAERLGIGARFVACTAPRGVLRARLEAREQRGAGPTDARAALLDSFLARYSAPTGSDVLTIDTARPVDIDAVLTFVREGATR